MNITTTFATDAAERLAIEVRRLQREQNLPLEEAIRQAGERSIAGPAVWAEVRRRLAPWVLRRDGVEVERFGAEQAAWDYLHRVHSYSVSHALEHEGYTLVQEVQP